MHTFRSILLFTAVMAAYALLAWGSVAFAGDVSTHTITVHADVQAAEPVEVVEVVRTRQVTRSVVVAPVRVVGRVFQWRPLQNMRFRRAARVNGRVSVHIGHHHH